MHWERLVVFRVVSMPLQGVLYVEYVYTHTPFIQLASIQLTTYNMEIFHWNHPFETFSHNSDSNSLTAWFFVFIRAQTNGNALFVAMQTYEYCVPNWLTQNFSCFIFLSHCVHILYVCVQMKRQTNILMTQRKLIVLSVIFVGSWVPSLSFRWCHSEWVVIGEVSHPTQPNSYSNSNKQSHLQIFQHWRKKTRHTQKIFRKISIFYSFIHPLCLRSILLILLYAAPDAYKSLSFALLCMHHTICILYVCFSFQLLFFFHFLPLKSLLLYAHSFTRFFSLSHCQTLSAIQLYSTFLSTAYDLLMCKSFNFVQQQKNKLLKEKA